MQAPRGAPPAAARSSGVRPAPSLASGCAPCASSRRRQAREPPSAAACSAVVPSRAACRASAPACSSSAATRRNGSAAGCPSRAAARQTAAARGAWPRALSGASTCRGGKEGVWQRASLQPEHVPAPLHQPAPAAHLGASLDKQRCDTGAAADGSQEQRRPAGGVAGLHVCAVPPQQRRRSAGIHSGCQHEGSEPFCSALIHAAHSGGQQHMQAVGLVGGGSQVAGQATCEGAERQGAERGKSAAHGRASKASNS